MSDTIEEQGSITPNDSIACKTCHAPIHKLAEICPKCGVRQRGKPADKVVLLLITFFLGGIGMHKFYVRQYGWGVAYLLLSWTGIPSLVALVEFFITLFTSAEKIEEKYSSTGSVVIIVIVSVFFFIAIIGILAAISIPAYQDYVVRARVSEVINHGKIVTLQVDTYYLEHGKYPGNTEELGVDQGSLGQNIQSLEVTQNGLIIITFAKSTAMAADKTIIFEQIIRDGQRSWDCRGGTLPRRLRTTDCR